MLAALNLVAVGLGMGAGGLSATILALVLGGLLTVAGVQGGADIGLVAGIGLTAAFGKPAFVRQDGVIQMWRYDGDACRAFFFLYGAPLAVRHVETLPHGVQSAADSACLTALRASPQRTS